MAGKAKVDYPPLLPDGLHRKTVEEIQVSCCDDFSLSASRSRLMAGLRRMVERLQSEGIQGDLWIDGSFVTKKLEPDDVDIVLEVGERSLIAATHSQGAFLQWFQTSSEPGRDYSCDCYLFCQVPQGHPWYPGFDIRAYWVNQFGRDRSNNPKGIVVLTLNGGVQ